MKVLQKEGTRGKNNLHSPVQIMAVLALPPRLFCRILVSLLSLYGMWAETPLLSFWMT